MDDNRHGWSDTICIPNPQRKQENMIGIIFFIIAGVAEHFKDLSAEGKLKGYWDKNHVAKLAITVKGGKYVQSWVRLPNKEWGAQMNKIYSDLFWVKGWLQGGIWDKVPVFIRQYLSFRDGWHLLKFISLTSFACGVVVFAGVEWWWFLIIRTAFSLPETILRYAGK
jgi:hypothetical protein